MSAAYKLFAIVLLTTGLTPGATAHKGDTAASRMPSLGAAFEFQLTAQDGTTLSLQDLRGRIVVVSFIYTRCADVCPLLTTKLVAIQKSLGGAFGRDVFFLSVTVDPEHDRPGILEDYAEALGCDLTGWAFLTGTQAQITEVARGYGVYHESRSDGDTDHNLLTSLVDRTGRLRVQYMGERFDPDMFLKDLRRLMDIESTR